MTLPKTPEAGKRDEPETIEEKYYALAAKAEKLAETLAIANDVLLGASRRLDELKKPTDEINWAIRNGREVLEAYRGQQ